MMILNGCLKPPLTTGPKVPLTSSDPGNPHNLLSNGTFDDGSSLPWTSSFTAPGSGQAFVENGAYCLEVTNQGNNAWDAQVRHREMVIQRGHSYSIRYTAWASENTKVRPKVGMAGPPYAEYWFETIELTPTPRVFTAFFRMSEKDDPTAEFTFHMGGALARAKTPFRVCLDDVVLADPEFIRVAKESTQPSSANIFVNQQGYLPNLKKIAVMKSESTAPLRWQLLDASGAEVSSGMTGVFGRDTASGDSLHWIDFSAFQKPMRGLVLQAGGFRSHPFDIDARIYHRMKYDALAYFYHNRSGIEIKLPYAGQKCWTRPAGHLGDKKVACAPNSGCNYSLDVSGGWYDAGDHGKYVVNGGISLWTLFNMYERAKYLGTNSEDFADGRMNIPENRNGVSDLLDEARYQMEFMLKMQVPEGMPLAGMAHHKIHDENWTELGVAPHEDKMTRYLQRPSTAATLNLAASAAQCARIYKDIDPAFAAKCLTAAERAWAAAQENPDRLITAQESVGGGAYDDSHVQDEFYWAAAELFVTSGKDIYRDYMVNQSQYFKAAAEVLKPQASEAGMSTSMTWQNTETLGTISLAVVPNRLPAEEVEAMRRNLINTADSYVKLIDSEGYRVPFKPGPDNQYPWGSNSFILNNLLLIALAYDFTKEIEYLNNVAVGMDYIMGRNPMDQCYVTGYGDRPLRNPHHRFWSHQIKSSNPPAPPGAVSGGPNSSLQDPYARAAGLVGRAPQKCFIDHIESWSTNEIAINWNAVFAWITAFLDEQASK
ncbi:MAG: glycoside hydrolase family 9 protein [Deltaproteobacteria bacterium]|nr:glycoside hydrolase family 9 protein [Deltaproteobacteria bacterium]